MGESWPTPSHLPSSSPPSIPYGRTTLLILPFHSGPSCLPLFLLLSLSTPHVVGVTLSQERSQIDRKPMPANQQNIPAKTLKRRRRWRRESRGVTEETAVLETRSSQLWPRDGGRRLWHVLGGRRGCHGCR